jgi:hypothetical protein
MINRHNEPTQWDYLADLKSGRLHSFVGSFYEELKTLREMINDMATANEQRLTDAANAINAAAETFSQTLATMQAKVDTLVEQAKSPSPTPEPEDLSQEFAQLDAALAKLGQAGQTVSSTDGTTGGGTTNGDGGVVTPLAGESGTTNPTPENDGPSVDQQAPGTTGTGTGDVAPVLPDEAPPTDEAPPDSITGDDTTPASDTTASPASPAEGSGESTPETPTEGNGGSWR